MKLQLLLPTPRIPSVNELYLFNKTTGEVYKNPEVTRVIDQMRTFLADNYSLSYFRFLNRKSIVQISYDFIVRKSVLRRDVSNMIKSVQDIITRYIGIDDSQVISLYARKSFKKDLVLEYVNITIEDNFEITTPRLVNPIIIPVEYIPSINNTYGYDPGSKQVYKETWIHVTEKKIQDYLRKTVMKSQYRFVTNNNRFVCHYDFFLNKFYEPLGVGVEKSRDADNLIKVVEDAIFRFFGVDDSRVLEIYARKHNLPRAGSEYIAFSIEESNYDINSFQV